MGARLVVLASGNGSNLQAILDACQCQQLDAQVVAVVSDQADAYALRRGADAGVPGVHIGRRADEARVDYDARLADVVAGFDPDWIVLAGWMRILTINFLGWVPNRVINLHPALPGELAGINAIERAWEQAVAGERTGSGVMVHLVPDEGVDDGPVLGTSIVSIDVSRGFDAFAADMHAAEHELLVDVIASLTAPDTPPSSPSPTSEASS